MSQPDNITEFPGWEKPQTNYFKVPNAFWLIDDIDVHQRMVLLYLLRHTWGFKEYDIHKPITIDEFQNGRKRKNGTRLDKGCGVSRGKVSSSLSALEAKGYISVEVDDSDPARIKKSYMLKMQPIQEDSQDEPVESNEALDSVHVVNPEFTARTQRSSGDNRTEKETKERNLKKEDIKNTSDSDTSPSVDEEPIEDETQDNNPEVQKDTNKQARGLIAVYLKTTKTVNSSAYRFWMKEAQELAENSITPAHVAEWIKHTTSQDWWTSGNPSWGMMCQKIIAWRDEYEAKKAAPAIDRRLQARKLPVNIDMLTGEQSA